MARASAADAALDELSKDWRRLRQQKHRMRGGVEARIINNLGMWYAEHYLQQARDTILSRPLGKDEDKNKLFLVFNLVRKQVRRKIGRLWSVAPEFKASPNRIDPAAMDQADVVNDLILALNTKVRERQQQWRRLWWMCMAGVVVEHTPWVEDITQEPLPQYDPDSGELLWEYMPTGDILPQSMVEQATARGLTPESFKIVEHMTTVGDIGSTIVNPLQFFIDAAVPTIAQLGPDQLCYIAEIKTKGWIKEHFGSAAAKSINGKNSDLNIVQTRLLDRGPSMANINLRDLIPAVQGSRGALDPDMAIVITGYQPANKEYPHGRRAIFVPDQTTLDDGDLPYSELPCTDFHFEPPENTFWGGDFVSDMIPAQKFLNKRWSQLGEASNASIYEIMLLGSGLQAKDVPTDMPGVIVDGLDEQSQPRIQPLQRGALPGWFMETIKLNVEFIESVGSADLAQSRSFPGQLRGPLAIPMLQEILDSEDGPLFDHMGEQLARVHQQRINLVKQYYPPIRTLHYTGPDRKNETLVFHSEAILHSGTDFSVSVDRGSLLPELSALREARVRERLEGPLSILYTNRRTGRIDPSMIAMDLKYTDRGHDDREAQYRKLAQHFIGKLWKGEPLPQGVPYSFYDHNVMLDEYESAMAKTEWHEASTSIQQAFLGLYNQQLDFLNQIQAAQAQAMEGAQSKAAIAMATQQVAAKVAAQTVQESIEQIRESAQMARALPPAGQGAAEAAASQGISLRGATRRTLPPAPPPNPGLGR